MLKGTKYCWNLHAVLSYFLITVREIELEMSLLLISEILGLFLKYWLAMTIDLFVLVRNYRNQFKWS